VKEILDEVERWREAGEKVVVATVVATRRSAPRPVGTSLAISESGKMCGSVSGGCVESDVFENAMEVRRHGLERRPAVRRRDRRFRGACGVRRHVSTRRPADIVAAGRVSGRFRDCRDPGSASADPERAGVIE
jgi:xanthine/CO dehydrogenase XdhC/CoxF family maturation factor